MIHRLYRYFFPKYHLPRIPARHLSAEYENDLTPHQAMIMQAGLARDPSKAQAVWDSLVKQHGDHAYKVLEHYIALKRSKRLIEKFWRLMRKIFGELEHENLRPHKKETRVMPTYRYEDDER